MISLAKDAGSHGDLEFDDLLFDSEDGDAVFGAPPPKPAMAHAQRKVSALTARVQQMSVDVDGPDHGFGAGQQPSTPTGQKNVNSVAERDFQLENGPRLGASAPVAILNNTRTWQQRPEPPCLDDLDEENYEGPPRATTFVPPHLLVEKPAIQFSLNNSTADKRAKLRARAEILMLTGFIEPSTSPQIQTDWSGGSGVPRPHEQVGGLSGGLGRQTGTGIVGPKPNRSSRLVGVLSKEFGGSAMLK